MLLEDRVALVTGGGRGIGAAIARVLAREGAAVAVNYSTSQEKAERVARQITDAGGRAIAVRADVRDPDAVKAMVEQVVAAYGRVDGLVNNAIGGRQAGKLEEASLEDYETAFGFGARAVEHGARGVVGLHGRERRDGRHLALAGGGAGSGEHYGEHGRPRLDGGRE